MLFYLGLSKKCIFDYQTQKLKPYSLYMIIFARKVIANYFL